VVVGGRRGRDPQGRAVQREKPLSEHGWLFAWLLLVVLTESLRMSAWKASSKLTASNLDSKGYAKALLGLLLICFPHFNFAALCSSGTKLDCGKLLTSRYVFPWLGETHTAAAVLAKNFLGVAQSVMYDLLVL
jgi:hypothetical protein